MVYASELRSIEMLWRARRYWSRPTFLCTCLSDVIASFAQMNIGRLAKASTTMIDWHVSTCTMIAAEAEAASERMGMNDVYALNICRT